MKNRNIENRLAWVGVLIVLIGVSAAATSAFATESSDATTIATAAERDYAVAEPVNGARRANAEAAAEAAEALKIETALDLDIQLGDLTSTLIARNK